jgi:hypothetical protein
MKMDPRNGLPAKAPPDSGVLQHVRSLVNDFGWNATAYQIINPGISHWFSRSDFFAGTIT